MPAETLDLPDLHQAVLDAATIDQLFADIDQCAELIEVMVKPAARAHTPQITSCSLAQARRLLDEGDALGVQLRYGYQGAQWWDTLMHTPQGVRLVRIRHALDLPWSPMDASS